MAIGRHRTNVLFLVALVRSPGGMTFARSRDDGQIAPGTLTLTDPEPRNLEPSQTE